MSTATVPPHIIGLRRKHRPTGKMCTVLVDHRDGPLTERPTPDLFVRWGDGSMSWIYAHDLTTLRPA